MSNISGKFFSAPSSVCNIAEIRGDINATDLRVAILAARFNQVFTEKLVAGASEALTMHGGQPGNIKIIYAPGSFEIPVVAGQLASSGEFDAIVCVGCLIKGETDHYDLISSSVASGISKISIDTGVVCTLGVICARDMDQALARSGAKSGNYGWSAAVAAIETATLLKKLKRGQSAASLTGVGLSAVSAA